MEKRSFIMGIAIVLMLAGTGGGDEVKTKTKHVSCKFSETFANGVETHIDTNGDNISAGLSQGLENCNTGRFFIQEEAEFQAPLPAPVTCPAGTLELHMQQDHGVVTKEKTSDQLFFEVATNGATECFNPADGTFSFTAHGTITGGTGQFTDATGSFQSQGTGKFLVAGMKGGVFGGFGQFAGTSTGTLTLPKGSEDGQSSE